MESVELPQILVKPSFHRNNKVLKLIFPYHEDLIKLVRGLPGARWSSTMKCWYLPDSDTSLAKLGEILRVVILSDAAAEAVQSDTVSPEVAGPQQLHISRHSKERIKLVFRYDQELVALIKTVPVYYYDVPQKFWTLPHLESVLELLTDFCKNRGWLLEYNDEWSERKTVARKTDSYYKASVCPALFEEKLKIKRYSESTVMNYCSAIREFVHYYHDKSLESIEQEDIERFLLYLTEARRVSVSYQNISISAIKFYYEEVLGREKVTYKLGRPRREKVLPQVLSEEEVRILLTAAENLKHKCILMTLYSGGLRLSEVVGLRVCDIDSKRMMIFIRAAKGKKDRYTILSAQLLKWLKVYYMRERPKKWLFEGALGGQYSMQSVQHIMRDTVDKAGIRKHATVHTLRHSFATHMLENGTSLRYIQNLLGHNSSKTTEVYTHITTKGLGQLVSPFDRLQLEADLPEAE